MQQHVTYTIFPFLHDVFDGREFYKNYYTTRRMLKTELYRDRNGGGGGGSGGAAEEKNHTYTTVYIPMYNVYARERAYTVLRGGHQRYVCDIPVRVDRSPPRLAGGRAGARPTAAHAGRPGVAARPPPHRCGTPRWWRWCPTYVRTTRQTAWRA